MRNLLAFAVKAVISGVLLYFAFAHVKLELIVRRFDQLRYLWLAAGALALTAQILLGALRWQTIIGRCKTPEEPPFTIANAVRYLFVGIFFNQTLPSTVGGDAVRIWLLARENGGWRSATYSVLIDRMIGVLTLALVVIACTPCSFALIQDQDVTGP